MNKLCGPHVCYSVVSHMADCDILLVCHLQGEHWSTIISDPNEKGTILSICAYFFLKFKLDKKQKQSSEL